MFLTVPSLNNEYEVNEDGTRFRKVGSRVDLPASICTGYLAYSIRFGYLKQRLFAHKLVAEAFLGIPPKFRIGHKDGNNQNNHYENLYRLSSCECRIDNHNFRRFIDAARYLSQETGREVSAIHCFLQKRYLNIFGKEVFYYEQSATPILPRYECLQRDCTLQPRPPAQEEAGADGEGS